MKITIDFETRSPWDLKTRGAWNYSKSKYTEIMCCAVKVDDGPTMIWVDEKYLPVFDRSKVKFEIIPENEMKRLILEADDIVAHNSMFEFLMINNNAAVYRGWPTVTLDKMHDTMAQAAYHALPLTLEDVGRALHLDTQKDKKGHSVMLKLCKPKKLAKKLAAARVDEGWSPLAGFDYEAWNAPESDEPVFFYEERPGYLEDLFNYCGRDVAAEYKLHTTLEPLPESEREVWLMDQAINLRGVPFDRATVEGVVDVVTIRENKLLDEFQKLTDGAVSGPRSYVALRHWVNEKLGLEMESLGKGEVADLLNRKNLFKKKDPDGVVHKVLEIKAELSKASVAKFRSMLAKADPNDDRLRLMFQYHGAGTGRWGGRDVQFQNLPRDSYKTKLFEMIAPFWQSRDADAVELLFDDPFFAASRCIRGSIKARPGHEFICFDFKSIEAVVNGFLAHDISAMETFFNKQDPYRKLAAQIFNTTYEAILPEGDTRRQVGKCGELALGFLGGIGAFASMSNTYRIDLETLPEIVMPNATSEELEGDYGAKRMAELYCKDHPDTMSLEAAIACDVIKQKWRQAHPEIVEFGRNLEAAAKMALDSPGKVFRVNELRYCFTKNFLKCMLPSGRMIHYYEPAMKIVKTNFGKKETLTYMALRVIDGKTTRRFARVGTYSGKLLENAVQGTARDLLCNGMLNCIKAGFDVMMHVHDEAVAEVKIGDPKLTAELFEKEFITLPWWAEGWPVRADGWVGPRYQK